MSYRVLFVCLGNICRSPLAKAVFTKLVEEHGLDREVTVDSCGTGGWHVGQGAHLLTIKTAQQIGISLADHRARQLDREDFELSDLIVAMDRSNYRDIEHLKPGSDKVVLLRSFENAVIKGGNKLVDLEGFHASAGNWSHALDVPDPFEEGPDGFLMTQKIIINACHKLFEYVTEQVKAKEQQSQ